MKKKQYISPEAQVYHVGTCEVFCGTGYENASLGVGNGNNGPIVQPGGSAGGDASGRRGWDDYEGM